MPDLNFKVEGAQAVPYGASPLLAFQLRVTNAGPELKPFTPWSFARKFKSK